MQFYNVRTRAFVEVSNEKLTRKVYTRETSKGTQQRFAVRATLEDGTRLTKFISRADFDALDVPIEE